MLLQLRIERLLKGILPANAQNLAPLQQHIRQHKKDHTVLVLLLGLLHQLEERLLPPQLAVGIHTGDLPYAKIVARNVELLEVRK